MGTGVRKIQMVNFEGKKINNQCENLLYVVSLCDCKEPVLLPTLHTKQFTCRAWNHICNKTVSLEPVSSMFVTQGSWKEE